MLNKVSTLCVNYLNNNSFWFFILESVTSECVPLKQRRIKTSTFIFFFSQTNYSSFFNFLFHLIINKTLLRQHMASFFNTDYSYDHILLKNFCKSIRHWILFHKEANMTKKNLFFPTESVVSLTQPLIMIECFVEGQERIRLFLLLDDS